MHFILSQLRSGVSMTVICVPSYILLLACYRLLELFTAYTPNEQDLRTPHLQTLSDGKFAAKTEEFLPHVRLAKDLLDERRYDNRVRPVFDHHRPTVVKYSMSLYQILAIVNLSYLWFRIFWSVVRERMYFICHSFFLPLSLRGNLIDLKQITLTRIHLPIINQRFPSKINRWVFGSKPLFLNN